MISNRPYLIRAIYEWLVDNDWTPQLLIHADDEGVLVPREYVRDGEIVLNISPTAVQNLVLGNESIDFDARFSGRAMHVSVPVKSVVALFARENGQGMAFPEEELPETSHETTTGADAAKADVKKGKTPNHLKIIK
jgi:stringent starvation protein B